MAVFPACHALATCAVTLAVSRHLGIEPKVHQFSATEQELNLPSRVSYQNPKGYSIMLKGYKTQIWNCIVGTFGILEVADMSFLPEAYKGYAIVGIAVVSFWLRTLTTGPVGAK